jgi:hypothetical protein
MCKQPAPNKRQRGARRLEKAKAKLRLAKCKVLADNWLASFVRIERVRLIIARTARRGHGERYAQAKLYLIVRFAALDDNRFTF